MKELMRRREGVVRWKRRKREKRTKRMDERSTKEKKQRGGPVGIH